MVRVSTERLLRDFFFLFSFSQIEHLVLVCLGHHVLGQVVHAIECEDISVNPIWLTKR